MIRTRHLLAVLLLAVGLTPGAAWGVPSGGASPDTPGTSASVSPRSVPAGGTVSFRVSGFPAGEVVYVKIDDGRFCSESGVHGACVVQQQRIPASGTVTGSLVLPSDLAAGAHWLRFLASQEMYDADGTYQGIQGFTARGDSDFTVVAASSTAPTPTAPSASAPQAASTSPAADTGAPAGSTLTATPTAPSTTSTPGPTSAVTPTPTPAEPAPVAAAVAADDDQVPVVGIAGLAVMCAMAVVLLLRARRGRG